MKNKSAEFFRNFEIFNNENAGSVRTLADEEGNIWFLANDICECLEYENNRKAIADHTDLDDRKALKYKDCNESLRTELFGENDFKDKIFINEAGVYQMIFESQMPKAKEFKSWVTHEVIPSIREHGGYILGIEKLSKKERENVAGLISSLKDKVAFLQKQRHMHISNNKELKETVKDLKGKNQKLNGYLLEEEERNEKYMLEIAATIKSKDAEVKSLLDRIEQLEDPEAYELRQRDLENKKNPEIKYISSDGLVMSEPVEIDK